MARKAAFLLIAPLALLLGGDGDALSITAPKDPCPGIGRTMDARLQALFDKAPETRAVALEVDGCRVFTRYAPGYATNQRFISWSMAKSVTAMLVGALVHDGKLRLDDPLPLAEWRGANDPHRAITLRQMLNMESGVRHAEVRRSGREVGHQPGAVRQRHRGDGGRRLRRAGRGGAGQPLGI
ncbi:MAG: serine hydrolase [Sphingomonas sp.]